MIYTHDEYKRDIIAPRTSLHSLRQQNKQNEINSLLEAKSSWRDDNLILKASDRNSRRMEENKRKFKMAKDTERLEETYLFNTLSEVFLNALPLDEDFINEHRESLSKVFCKELTHLAESSSKLLENMKNSDSDYLKELSEAIKKKAREDAKAIADCEKCDEECKKDRVKHNDSHIASDMIKDKVMKTIKKENEISKKEKDIQDQLTKAQQMNESVKVNYKGKGLIHYSLFKSIMMNSYKESLHGALSECVSSHNVIVGDDGIKVDTDKILAESIIKYTAIETLNTLKLKKFTPRDVIQLADAYAYKQFK